MASQRWRPILFAGAAAAAALGLTACGSSGAVAIQKTASPSATASATPSASAIPSAVLTGAPATRAPTGAATGGGDTGTVSGGVTGATITLTLTRKPACPSGTNVTYFAGNDATISWTSTGATGVQLNVDGSPGIYGFYGPSGTLDIGFPCDAPVNTVRTHTYTITTKGGAVISKTISAAAIVNEVGVVVSQPPPASASPSASASP